MTSGSEKNSENEALSVSSLSHQFSACKLVNETMIL